MARSPEERLRVCAEWAEARQATVRALSDCADNIEELTEVLTAYFSAATVGQVYDRKPPLALRIPLPGEPSARLVCCPTFVKREKRVNANTIKAEVMLDITGPLATRRVFVMTVHKDQPGKSYLGTFRRDAVTFVPRMVDAVHLLLSEPEAVFALLDNRCACCGKRLTDPISKGRGVGPECLQAMDGFIGLLKRAKEKS